MLCLLTAEYISNIASDKRVLTVCYLYLTLALRHGVPISTDFWPRGGLGCGRQRWQSNGGAEFVSDGSPIRQCSSERGAADVEPQAPQRGNYDSYISTGKPPNKGSHYPVKCVTLYRQWVYFNSCVVFISLLNISLVFLEYLTAAVAQSV